MAIFESPGAPAAVLEIEIFLHNENPANPGIVLHKRYMKSVRVEGTLARSIGQGFGARRWKRSLLCSLPTAKRSNCSSAVDKVTSAEALQRSSLPSTNRLSLIQTQAQRSTEHQAMWAARLDKLAD